MNEEKIIEIINHIYDTVMEEALWPDVLTEIGRVINARNARIVSFYGHSIDQYSISHNNYENAEELNDIFRKNFLFTDDHATRPFLIPTGSVRRDRDFISVEEMNVSPFYHEFLFRNDMSAGLQAKMELVHGQTTLLQFRRQAKAEDFSDEDVGALESIFPHLQRALQWQQLIRNTRALASIGYEITDRLGCGVVILKQNRDVFFSNDTARLIAAQDDGLILTSRSVGARNPGENSILQGLIKDVIERPAVGSNPARTSTLVHRSSEKRPYEVLVAPWTENPGGTPSQYSGFAILFIRDLDRPVFASPEILRELFGLTPAEARLASALAAGKTISGYSREHDLSEETVRWHLKQIRLKTHTNRLSGLMSLIFSGVSVITG